MHLLCCDSWCKMPVGVSVISANSRAGGVARTECVTVGQSMTHSKSSRRSPRKATAKLENVSASYRFLVAHEQAGTTFTIDDVARAAGWKPGTVRSYLNKKWSRFIRRVSDGYVVCGVAAFSEAEYLRLMSQRDAVSADPRRPELKPEVEALVREARESALLALHVYNSPATVFRTEGFTVLMVIAWTALFHAIFEERGETYFYTEPDGITPKMVDGDQKAWELATCMTKYWGGADHASRRNLDFFIRLRNRIEHRYVPAIDPHVAGECQSLLFNFDELLVQVFGEYFAIRESLAVPLQTGTLRNTTQLEALKSLQSKHFDDVKQFIDAYRKDLPSGVYDDSKFAFRVFLIPKTGNHAASSDLAMEFVKYDPTRPDEMAALQKQITMIKEKHVEVVNANLLTPTDVARQVAKRIGRPFTSNHHVRAWQRYNVRKRGFDPTSCNRKYCVPDARHKDYAYTTEWMDFLVSKMTGDVEYTALVGTRAFVPAATASEHPPSTSPTAANLELN
jgi:hypothetical protein